MSGNDGLQLPISTEPDVVYVRQAVRKLASELGFSLIDQTKLVTATSELARNALIYGGGGMATIEKISQHTRTGIRLTIVDQGPGIENIEKALQDGYSTGSGLGLGLGGAKRLSNEFELQSTPGAGTKVAITRWL
ncbi:MAG: anti-sigma regulatory factor [Verrucomicrobiota bacterium JB022]|nr:anti-sigma regulatory factor [Verrucomicrobiota bacterium JB022]